MADTSPRRVLVVDDEASIRRMIEVMLTAHDYEVYEAESAEAGMQIFREKSPDVVLTDLVMAGLDGADLIREIRRISPETRVIVMSGGARFGIDVPTLAQQLGAAEALQKPFRSADLLLAIRESEGGPDPA